ncbi:mechanosensitive ion channel family protein [Sphingomonas sp. R86521]|uniref:mechanosensitive ion channel family protein n=1 Tax=Sphingomonas sp. R86521 TaxID=3093860 RepID=UPI0036D35C37
MTTFILPIGLLVVTLVGTLLVRSRSEAIRATFDLALFVLLGCVLFREDTSPILTGANVPMGPEGHWLRAVGIVWWYAAARLATAGIGRLLGHDERSREARITSDLLSAAVYIATILIVLNFVLLLPVNGLLATSGIIAVVIGLALQNTLADVFSGIAVGIEHPFSVGDRVTLGEGVEGLVVQVNWRSIRIQTDGEDVATIPNSVVAKAQILNRSFPTERRSARVMLNCPAWIPPERIIVLLKHASLLCPNILASPPAVVTVVRLGVRTNAYAIDFFVCTTREIATTKSFLLQHAHRQLRHAGLLDEVSPTNALLDAVPPALRLVREIELFASLTAEQQTELAARMEHRRLKTDEVLFREGDEDQTLYMVGSGIVEITRHGQGGVTSIGRIGAGEYIGEIGLLTGAPHAATATAFTPSAVYSLPPTALLPILAADPELAVAFEQSVHRGLTLLDRKVAAEASAYPQGPGALLHNIRRFFASSGPSGRRNSTGKD